MSTVPDLNLHLDRGLRKTVDWVLVGCYAALLVIGLLNIYASIHSAEPSSIFDFASRSGKQFVWIVSALALDVLILFIFNPRWWEALALPSYLAVYVLLVLVIFVSNDVKGSHSWFELGPVSFQPAELSKITTSLLLAAVMGRQGFLMSRPRDFLMVALIVGVPMLTIVAESETGSALVYMGFLFVLYREGLSGWWLFLLLMAIVLFILTLTTSWAISAGVCLLTALVVVIYKRGRHNSAVYRRRLLLKAEGAVAAGMALVFATGFIFDNVLQDHQRKRIEVLLGITEDPAGVGYNVRQSMIAIGSGGLYGKGFLSGTQTTYGFVPEQSTDFIFCTVGEEWGFVGCLVTLLLYGLLISRIVSDAERSREAFTRIYGYCVAACFFMHLFINVGMTIGIMPVIGIPLPFLSYGGSSLWAFSGMLFIFIALNRQEKKYF